MDMLAFTKVILKFRTELCVYRAGYGIWVKPLLCRGSRSWCWCRGSIIWLSSIRACISRLGASDLPKCPFKNNSSEEGSGCNARSSCDVRILTVLLGGESSLHARLAQRRLLQGPRQARHPLWACRQVVALSHGSRGHMTAGRWGA